MDIVKIKTEYIKLDQFLKYVSIASDGAEAKFTIKFEDVYVNGAIEKRRGKKLRKGDIVKYETKEYLID